MKTVYYLNSERKKNLYCRISDGSERITFSLEYTVKSNEWDVRVGQFVDTSEYYYTLIHFKRYLDQRHLELKAENKSDILALLKNEASTFVKGAGLDGLARNMYDYFHEEFGIPKYDEFVAAFEKYSNLKKGEFKVEPLDSSILFHTKNGDFIMDSYEGKTHELKLMIEKRIYDELSLETDLNIWAEIYIDAGIEKHVFIPTLLSEWESCWQDKLKNISRRTNNLDHMNSMKQESWRQFQVFMECYASAGNIIELAFDIDDCLLYPLCIIAMMNIFDAETCYGEYCEHEFYASGRWESIDMDEEDENAIIFYIKPYENK